MFVGGSWRNPARWVTTVTVTHRPDPPKGSHASGPRHKPPAPCMGAFDQPSCAHQLLSYRSCQHRRHHRRRYGAPVASSPRRRLCPRAARVHGPQSATPLPRPPRASLCASRPGPLSGPRRRWRRRWLAGDGPPVSRLGEPGDRGDGRRRGSVDGAPPRCLALLARWLLALQATRRCRWWPRIGLAASQSSYLVFLCGTCVQHDSSGRRRGPLPLSAQ